MVIRDWSRGKENRELVSNEYIVSVWDDEKKFQGWRVSIVIQQWN